MRAHEHTREAWLVNGQGRYTLHQYVGTQDIDTPLLGILGTGIALMYRCTQTGVIRRWGLLERPMASMLRDSAGTGTGTGDGGGSHGV